MSAKTTTTTTSPTTEGIPPAADSNPLAVADPTAHGMSAERLERVGALMQKMVDEGTIPYARCKIMRHGQLVYDSTVNSALGTQTEDSIYRFYSMTKIVASAVCMIGVERGLMRLDDPIEKYIPEFASTGVYKSGTVEGGDLETEPAATMATVRQCLTHTAGFGYGGLFGAFGLSDEVCKAYIKEGCGADMLNGSMAAKWKSMEELAKAMVKCPLRHQPGTQYDYGMGHIIAGRCCEVAFGKSLTEIFQTEVFDPLEMTTAGWGVHESNPNVLPMYRYNQFDFVDPTRPWKNKFGDLQPHENGPSARINDHCKSQAVEDAALCLMPDAQMTGRADDWHKFFYALANGGTAANGHQLLSPVSIKTMFANSLPGGKAVADMFAPFAGLFAKPWMGFGLGGFSVKKIPGAPSHMAPGSYGWNGAAGTKAMWDLETGVGFIFYTQVEFSLSPIVDDYDGELTAAIYGAVVDKV